VAEPNDREPAKCSKHVVSPLAGKSTLGTFNVTARLRHYIDISGEQTKKSTATALKETRTFARHAYLKNQRAPIVKASTSPANSRLTPAENCSVK